MYWIIFLSDFYEFKQISYSFAIVLTTFLKYKTEHVDFDLRDYHRSE